MTLRRCRQASSACSRKSACDPWGGLRKSPWTFASSSPRTGILQEMVAEKKFREDLYYRLHVVELHVPPLRDRAEDIPLLIDHFISIFATRYRRDRKTVSREAVRRLCGFPWPGNVRQLEHVLLSAWLMSEGLEIGVEDIELPTTGRLSKARPASQTRRTPTRGGLVERRQSCREQGGAPGQSSANASSGALTSANWPDPRCLLPSSSACLEGRSYRRLQEFGLVEAHAGTERGEAFVTATPGLGRRGRSFRR